MAEVHRWKLQDSGGPVVDAVGGRDLATIEGAVTFEADGTGSSQEKAIELNGVNESVSSVAALGGSWDDQTAMIWFRPKLSPPGFSAICGTYGSGSGNASWMFRHLGSSSRWDAFAGAGSGTDHFTRQSVGTIAVEVWVHLAMRWSSVTDVLELLQNGVEITTTLTENVGPPTGSIFQGSGQMQIGQSPIHSSFETGGRLADCRIFDSFMSDAEITDAMNDVGGGGGGAGPGVSSFLRRNQPRINRRSFSSRANPLR